jgi:lysophospholipase L1-like esterase
MRHLAALALLAAAPAAAQPAYPEPAMVAQPCPADLTGLWAMSEAVVKNDWAFLCRYQAENRAVIAAGRPMAVFIGDSITEGWIKADPDFFARGNLDRGLAGQTSPQVLLRFQQDVIALHPLVVHIMVGTNDIAGNTGPTSTGAWQDNIRAMVALAKSHGIAVVLGSIPPADRFFWRPSLQPAGQVIELNAWLRVFARAEGLVFADYHAALADSAGGMPPRYGKDGVHPDAAGYAVMRGIAERALAEAMRRP